MELTYACNQRCIHCYNPERLDRDELSTEEVFSLIDGLARAGTLEVLLTGGEIFTRPDAMDVIRHLRQQGITVTLITNGSLIREDTADSLISLGVTRFQISFLGATRETFDGMTRVPGSFDRVVSTVRMLRGKGVTPHMRTCVTSMNVKEMEGITALTGELGARSSHALDVIPTLDQEQEPTCLRVSPEDFMDIRDRRRRARREARTKRPTARRRTQERPGFWERDCLFNCMAGRTTAFIDPYGRMKACMMLPEPSWDVREQGVRSCWESVKEFVDTLKPPQDWQCYTCEYQDWCSWCPGRAYLNTGSIFGCPDYYRELAKLRLAQHQERMKEATG